MAHVYCDRNGHVLIGPCCPPGMLPLADGPERVVRDAIEGSARLAYDGETWLVPGIPEARDDDAAVDAAVAFSVRLRQSVARRLEV